MQTLAEALGPLERRRRPGGPRCSDWIAPVRRPLRALRAGHPGVDRGRDRRQRVRPARHRRARPVHAACSSARIARSRRPTSTRRSRRSRSSRCSSASTTTCSPDQVRVEPDADRRHARARHARRAVRRVVERQASAVGARLAAEHARLQVAELRRPGPSTRPRPSRARSRRRRCASAWCTCCSTISSVVPASRIVSSVRYTSSTMIGARPSDSSSAISSRGCSTSTRASDEHALLAARERARDLPAPLAEPREQLVRLVERGAHAGAARGCGGTSARGSPATVSDANTERPSGACTIPSRANWYGGLAGDVVAVEAAPGPTVGAIEPGADARDRRLARAVRAEQREHAARAATRATRRRARGTARSRRRRRAARAAARRGTGPRARAAIRPGLRGRRLPHRGVGEHRRRSGPDAISVPKSSTKTRSTKLRTNSTSCSTSRIAIPCSLLHRRAACRASVVGLVRGRGPTTARRAAAASGSVISARPISTSRPTPRLSDSTGRSATASSPSSVEHRRRARFSSARSAGRRNSTSFQQRAACRCATRSATRRCSRGVMPANSSMRWNVRPMPSRARRCVGTRVEVAARRT